MSRLAIVERGIHVEIGEACLDTDADISHADASAILDEDERTRAASFLFERDRARFVRAHGYLRRELGAFLAMAPQDVPIAADPGGKPFVEGGGVDFNMSHSGAHIVLAITRGGEIGIDLETLDRSESLQGQLEGLAEFCMTSDERAALAMSPPDQKVGRFLSYWTAKEARMKLTGEGMKLEPRTIALQLSEGRPVGYRRPRSPRATLRFVSLSRADAICCLAVGV